MSLEIPQLEKQHSGIGPSLDLLGRAYFVAEAGWQFPRNEWEPTLRAVLDAATIAEQKRALTVALIAVKFGVSTPDSSPRIKASGRYNNATVDLYYHNTNLLRVFLSPLKKWQMPTEVTRITSYTPAGEGVHAVYRDPILTFTQQEFAHICSGGVAEDRLGPVIFAEGTEPVTGPARDLGQVVVSVLASKMERLNPESNIRSSLGLEALSDA